MKTKNRPSNLQIVIFFIGFVLLFILVFALGVIVGRGLNGADTAKVDLNEKFENEIVGGPDDLVTDDKVSESSPADLSKEDIDGEKARVSDIYPEDSKVAESKDVSADETNISNETEKQKSEDLQKTVDGEKLKTTNAKEEPTEQNENIKTATQEGKEEVKKQTAKLESDLGDFPKTDPDGKFTVQLGSFRNAQSAFDFEKKLNIKGYPSFVEKTDIPEKGTWYRVRVGSFSTKEKAEDYAEKIKLKEKLDFSQVTTTE